MLTFRTLCRHYLKNSPRLLCRVAKVFQTEAQNIDVYCPIWWHQLHNNWLFSCSTTSMTMWKQSQGALSMARTWLAHIGVHICTRIIEWIVLVRAVGGAVVGVVGLVRDGVRGVWSRWWWWASYRPWQWQPPVVSMVVSFPNTRLHFFWQVFDDLSTHVAPTIAELLSLATNYLSCVC